MKRKFSWGTGIVISFIVFMSSTLVVVIYLMNQKVDFVTDNYYEKELVYQDQIDRINRTNILADEQVINYNGKFVSITIPAYAENEVLAGEIYFYRPSDSKYDIKIPLIPDSTGVQIIPVKDLIKGLWMVKVNWNNGKEDFFTEKRVIVR